MKLYTALAVLPLAIAQIDTTATASVTSVSGSATETITAVSGSTTETATAVVGSNSTIASTSASPTATGSSNSSRIIPINVGNGGLIFSPNSVTANVGDILSFTFYPQNHSVAQSIFTQPCQPANDAAIFSGFYPVAAGQESNTTFNVVVNGTDPLWFYCSQARHCEQGMVFVVNENTPSGNTLAVYAAAAANAQTESPAQVQGGTDSAASNSTSSPTSSPSGTSAVSGSAASGSASGTASGASTSPTSGAAAQLGWGSLGSAGIAAFVLRALL